MTSDRPTTIAAAISDVSPSWANVTDISTDTPATGVELIHEGWLVHRGASRVVHGASPDLALLIGDWCYAAGLCEITDHGTLDDVARLAQLVADVSARTDESVEALTPRWTRTLTEMHDD